MYKIAICDDDKRYRKTIREIVEHKIVCLKMKSDFMNTNLEMNF